MDTKILLDVLIIAHIIKIYLLVDLMIILLNFGTILILTHLGLVNKQSMNIKIQFMDYR